MTDFTQMFLPKITVALGMAFAALWFCLPVTCDAQAGDVPVYTPVQILGHTKPHQTMFPTLALNIISQSGETSTFQVEVATTSAQQHRGLMFRESLAPDRGMLFDYTQPRRINMWMKNTLISLDMLFFNADAKLVYIAANTKPLSQDLISVPVPVRYVLEVPGGTAQRLGLRAGDQMVLP